MAELRLFVNDIELDLTGSEEIYTSYAVNQLSNAVAGRSPIQSRQGIFTQTFELPLTAHNRKALGIPNDIKSLSQIPYLNNPAYLLESGSQTITGTLEIKRVTDVITVEVTGGNYEFFGLIADKPLREVNLKQFDHIWSFANVTASAANTYANGYIYANIDYGRFLDRLYDSGCLFDELFPAVFIRTILEKMADNAGYVLAGSFLLDVTFNRSVLVIPTGKYQHTEQYMQDFKVRASLVTAFTFDVVGGGVAVHEGAFPYDTELLDNSSQFNLGSLTFTAVRNGVVNVTGKINIKATLFDMDDSDTQVVFGITKNGINGFILLSNRFQATGPHPDGYEKFIRFSFNEKLYLKAGETCAFGMGVLANNCKNVILGFATGNEINYEYDNRVEPGDMTEMSFSLPDIKQTDFLSLIANKYNLLITGDVTTKTLQLERFNRVVDRAAEALDFTGKVDYSESPELSFIPGDYGQKSNFVYADDTYDIVLDDYRKLNKTGYGDSYLVVNNKNIPRTLNVFESQFAATLKRNSFSSAIQLPYVPIVIPKADTRYSVWNTSGVYNTKPVQDYVNYLGRYFRCLLNGVDFDTPPLNGTLDLNDTEWVEGDYIKFAGKDLHADNTVTPRFLVLDPNNETPIYIITPGTVDTYVGHVANCTFAPFEFRTLLIQNYATLDIALKQAKYIRCLMKLNAIDIMNLDFTRPVFIASTHPTEGSKFNAFFYISLIDQYRHGSTQSCYVELLRIDTVDVVSMMVDGLLPIQDGNYLLLEGGGFLLLEGGGYIIIG